MTLVQLEYIIAVDTYRHFVTAAEKCFITQPTLSMQIQKLEEELGILIFDRTKQPVIPTEVGTLIIEQARTILKEAGKIKEIIKSKKGEVEGEFRLGVIPTIAPYLLPLFLPSFLRNFPKVKLVVEELKTETIINNLKNDVLDSGILVGPLHETQLNETPLYYESFVAYLSKDNKLFKKTAISPEMIEPESLWILNEGHCMRTQVMNICSELGRHNTSNNLLYEAGSIETLKKLVDLNAGITFLPKLATLDLPKKERELIRYFKSPEPVREVSFVTHRNFLKKNIIDALIKEIVSSVPDEMKKTNKSKIIEIKL